MAFLPNEPETLDARLAFPDAQLALDDTALFRCSQLYSCGWYGTSVSRERGSFALVNRGGPAEGLVGDRVRLEWGDRSVVVYVVGTEDLDFDIHVTRRAFAALELLAVERIDVTAEVLSA